MKFFSILFVFLSFIFIYSSNTVKADDLSTGVATYVFVADKTVKNGSIISVSSHEYKISSVEYDPLVFGIVVQNPALSYGIDTSNAKYPIVSSGQVFVLVTTQNGNIKRGDLIATSKIPGVGMKATKSGYIVGSALGDYSSTDTKAAKLLPVALNIHFYTSRGASTNTIINFLNIASLAASDTPLTAFKYVIAALVVVFSFLLGVYTFGKIATKGIEALGRNPLAARMIQMGIIFNVVITVAIVGAGIFMALFILRL